VLEDGKLQPVQTIFLVNPRSNAATTGGASAGGAGNRAGTAASGSVVPGTATLGSVASGTAAPVGPAPSVNAPETLVRDRIMVFVFDLSHLSTDGYKRSRTAVESFLRDGALPTDVVGVVAGDTMLNNKLGTDKAALLKAMEKMKGPNQARYNDLRSWPRLIDDAEALAVARNAENTITNVVQRACTERPEDCTALGGRDAVRQQVEAKGREFTTQSQRDAQITLAALNSLANGLGRFPGRKQVVLLSDGFLTTELDSQLRAVVELAARSNVRFSTLDSRGLNRDPRSQSFMNDQPLTAAGDMSPVTFDANSDALSSIALDTGGEFLMNRNDLRKSLDIVSRNSGTYYLLGYATDNPLDGKYRKIDVKVTRPGVTVYARKGYVATPAPALSPKPPASTSGTPEPPSGASEPGTKKYEPPTGTSEPPSKKYEPPTGASELPTSAPEPPSIAPPARPNAELNVEALTRITPKVSASAAEKLANAGWDAYSKGDVATARDALAKAVAAGDTAPWVSYALGFSEYALGHFQPAATAWESVRTRVPDFMPVYFDLADANFGLGRSADALAVLRDAARRWPLDPDAQNALGTTLVRRGAYDDAIEVFTKIAAARPDDSLSVFNLGRVYHLRYLRLQQNIASAHLGDKSAIGEDDRQKAIASYRRYLSLGGPFEKDARDAIALLDWK
jgi:VWFA-related protein